MKTKVLKKGISLLLTFALLLSICAVVPLSVAAEEQTGPLALPELISPRNEEEDDVDLTKVTDKTQFPKTAFSKKEAEKFKVGADAGKIQPTSIFNGLIYGFAEGAAYWVAGKLMDALFGDGEEAIEYLSAVEARQMHEEEMEAISRVGKLVEMTALVNRANKFIESEEDCRLGIQSVWETFVEEYADIPDEKMTDELVQERLKLFTHDLLISDSQIDTLFNRLSSTMLTPYMVVVDGVPTKMDLFDTYRTIMRYTFPWESEAHDSLEAYYQAIANEFAIVSFIKVLSVSARAELATETTDKKVWETHLKDTQAVIQQVKDRFEYVTEHYVNIEKLPYHWFWSLDYSVKFARMDSYDIAWLDDPKAEGFAGYTDNDNPTPGLNKAFWEKTFTNRGISNPLDGDGYQKMMDVCKQYSPYADDSGTKDYPNATFEDLITWGKLGIKLNQKKNDYFLFKISDNSKKFAWHGINYDDDIHVTYFDDVIARGINADIKVETTLATEADYISGNNNTSVHIAKYSQMLFHEKEYCNFSDSINCFCLPVVEHPHILDGNLIDFKPWTSNNSLPTTAGDYYLTKDVTLTDTWSVPANVKINLCLNGHVIKTADSKTGINVLSTATLSIHDCNGDNCTHEGFVDSNGLWHLGSGSGTAVSFDGGVITGATHSAVVVYSGGTFNLYGGTLAGNKADSRGGAIENIGVFNMYGGAIRYNTSSNGGGLYTTSAYNKMYGGSISNNKAVNGGGVEIANNNAVFEMYNGEISYNRAIGGHGGGVDANYGTFKMHGGTINNNYTNSWSGAGVWNDANVIIGGTSVIKNNSYGSRVNNLRVTTDNSIEIGNGSNGVEAPTKGMNVGITLKDDTGAFTKSCSDYSAYFTSDNSAYRVAYNGTGKYLELKSADSAADHTTHKTVLQKGTAPKLFTAGCKDYYKCSCGKYYEDEARTVEIKDLDSWKAKGGNGYVAPTIGEKCDECGVWHTNGLLGDIFCWMVKLIKLVVDFVHNIFKITI